MWTGIKHFIETLCTIHIYGEVFDKAFKTSLKYGITVHDASYITLAENLTQN